MPGSESLHGVWEEEVSGREETWGSQRDSLCPTSGPRLSPVARSEPIQRKIRVRPESTESNLFRRARQNWRFAFGWVAEK